MNGSHQDSSNQALLVEGPDDQYVISHIRDLCAPDRNFSLIPKYGVSKLVASIEAEVNVDGRGAVGIVLDRDTDMSSRWDAVRNRLRDAGFDPPRQPDSDGTIIPETDELPRVGVWLMPDNELPGELEDFVVRMIPGNDTVWPLSEDYIDGIPSEDRKFTENKRQRAKVHAWLAAREDPRQMGQAIRAGDLEVDGELCQKFVEWLRKLFE